MLRSTLPGLVLRALLGVQPHSLSSKGCSDSQVTVWPPAVLHMLVLLEEPNQGGLFWSGLPDTVWNGNSCTGCLLPADSTEPACVTSLKNLGKLAVRARLLLCVFEACWGFGAQFYLRNLFQSRQIKCLQLCIKPSMFAINGIRFLQGSFSAPKCHPHL